MILTPHILAGAAIGANSSNFLTAFIFGLASHFVLDALPHWDYIDKIDISRPSHLIKIGLDFILGIIIVLLLTWSLPAKFFIWTAVAAAVLPDFLNAGYSVFKIKWLKPFAWFHRKCHIFDDLNFLPGLPAGLAVILISIYILL